MQFWKPHFLLQQGARVPIPTQMAKDATRLRAHEFANSDLHPVRQWVGWEVCSGGQCPPLQDRSRIKRQRWMRTQGSSLLQKAWSSQHGGKVLCEREAWRPGQCRAESSIAQFHDFFEGWHSIQLPFIQTSHWGMEHNEHNLCRKATSFQRGRWEYTVKPRNCQSPQPIITASSSISTHPTSFLISSYPCLTVSKAIHPTCLRTQWPEGGSAGLNLELLPCDPEGFSLHSDSVSVCIMERSPAPALPTLWDDGWKWMS